MGKRKYYSSSDGYGKNINVSKIKSEDFSLAKDVDICNGCENLREDTTMKFYNSEFHRIESYCEICQTGNWYDPQKADEYNQWLQFMKYPKLN